MSDLKTHQESIEKLKQWQDQYKKLSYRLVQLQKKMAEKSSSRKHIEMVSILNAIRPHAETSVSRINDLITGDYEDWQQASQKYHQMIKMAAHSLVPGFTTASIQKQRQIQQIFPDMTIHAKSQSGQKKGGKN